MSVERAAAVVPEVDALAGRLSIRVLVVDGDGRTLLCQYGDDTGRTWWVPPGGGKERGESDLDTARRELLEELERADLEIGLCIGIRDAGIVTVQGRRYVQSERFYLCRCPHFDITPDSIRGGRAEGIRHVRWFTSAELRDGQVDTVPRGLPDLLDRLAEGRVLPPDGDLGR